MNNLPALGGPMDHLGEALSMAFIHKQDGSPNSFHPLFRTFK
jgi:hypothetical protein